MSIEPAARSGDTGTGWSAFIVRELMQFCRDQIVSLKDHIRDLRVADDLRYQQRFDAQQKALEAAALAAEKAVNAALAAAEKAVNAAQQAAEKSVAAALASAEKAIEKAEATQAQHNVSQNEWRQTVNDLTKTVAETARHEVQSLVAAIRETTDISFAAETRDIAALRSRLDKLDGNWNGIAAFIGIALGLASLAAVLLGHR